MSTAVPYEPLLGRGSSVKGWVSSSALRFWFDTGLYRLPHAVSDLIRRGKLPPVAGQPGSPVPDAPGAYRVAAFGDAGEGTPVQARLAAQMLAWAPTHVATLGDNVYPLGRERDWARRFDPQYETLRMSTQWNPALGNHDYYAGDLTPYFKRFPHLQGRAYYSWSLGPAQFFVLDTEQRLDGSSAQQAWLAAELARSTARYKVIQMHRPMRGDRDGSYGDKLREQLGPLLARSGVQLVLQGHTHGYERFVPEDGITYMVSGGGGAATYGYPGKPGPEVAARTARHHYLQLSFTDEQMVVRAVDSFGTVLDTTTIAPRQARAGAATLARSA